jgi:hypothetical protein
MPEFEYFATFDESISILRDLCAQGFQVVAQPALFDEPAAPVFDQVNDELVRILKEAPGFYLAGSFTTHGVPYRQLKAGDAAGKFTIDIVTQGPLMQCLLARANEVGGVKWLLPGEISYQDRYRDPKTEKPEKASRAVISAFREAASVIKGKFARHKIGSTEIVIGPAALELLERGEARIKDSQNTRPSPS